MLDELEMAVPRLKGFQIARVILISLEPLVQSTLLYSRI